MNFFLSVFKLFPAESAHVLALSSLKLLHKLSLVKIFFKKTKDDKFSFANLNFNNRLGTAAGLDKNGDFIDCLGSLGFGFLEVGTVTPLAQKNLYVKLLLSRCKNTTNVNYNNTFYPMFNIQPLSL